MLWTRLAGSLTVALVLVGAQPAIAQDTPPSRSLSFTQVLQEAAKDAVGLASLDTAAVLAIGGAASLAVHPADRNVNWQLNGSDYNFLEPGRYVGHASLQMGIALATYFAGRAASADGRMAQVGQQLVRAQLITQAATFAIKVTTQRTRPDGSDNLSFPSGHASTTFAAATILAGNFGWRVSVPAYLTATYVASSRLHGGHHHISDVVFGSSLGIAVSRVTLQRDKARVAIQPIVMPGGAGVLMKW